MGFTRKLTGALLIAALAAGGTASAVPAKPRHGKGKEVRACMKKKGFTRADRGTAEFRAARMACRAEAGLPAHGRKAGRRGARS